MEKLSETISANGRVYKQVKRAEKKAMYKSMDGIIEVFKIRIDKKCEIFGREYPEREHYPSSEEFGVIAWCYTNMDIANRRYDSL